MGGGKGIGWQNVIKTDQMSQILTHAFAQHFPSVRPGPREPAGEQQSSKAGNGSAEEDYFLAGRNTPFWAVGLALFASNIGSEHLVGLAGSGAKVGICVSWGEWLSPLCILLLGWVFVPYYLQSSIYTMPEFLERRYSKGLRVYYALVLLAMYIMTKVSVALFAGAVVLKQTVGWDIWTSATVLVVVTGIYTGIGMGGLRFRLGFRVLGVEVSGSRVSGFSCGLVCRVFGFRVSGLGFSA